MQRHPEGCDPSSYRAYTAHRKPGNARERTRNRGSWDPTLITLPGMQTALRELERLGPSLYRGTIPRHNIDRLANDLTSILLTHVNQIRSQPTRSPLTTPGKEAVNDDGRSSRKHSSGSKEDHNQAGGELRFRRGLTSHAPVDERHRGVRLRDSHQYNIQETLRPRRRRRSVYYDDHYESEADEEFRRPQRPRRSKEIRENLNDDLAYEYIAEAARQQEEKRKQELEEAQKARLAAQAVESSDESEEEETFLKVVRPKLYVREWPLESDFASLTPISTEPDDDTDTEIYRKWNARRVRKPVHTHDAQESSIRELCSIFPVGRKNRLVSDMLVDINLMRRAAAVGQHAVINSNALQRLPRIPSRFLFLGGRHVRDIGLTQSVRGSLTQTSTSNLDINRQHEVPAPKQGAFVSGENVVYEKVHVPQHAGNLPSNDRSAGQMSRNPLLARRRPPMASLVGTRQGPGLQNVGSAALSLAAPTRTQSPVTPGVFNHVYANGLKQAAVDNHLRTDRTNRSSLTSGTVGGTQNLQLGLSLGQSSDINHTQLHPNSQHGIPQGVRESQMQNRPTLTPYGTVQGANTDLSRIVGTASANHVYSSSMHGYQQGLQQSKSQPGMSTGQISRSGVRLPHPHLQHYGVQLQTPKYIAPGQQNSYQRQMQNLLLQEQHRLLQTHRQQRPPQQNQQQQLLHTQQHGHLDRRLYGQHGRRPPILPNPQLTEEARLYRQLLQQQQSQMQPFGAQYLQEQASQAMKQKMQLQNLYQQRMMQYPMQFQQNQTLRVLNNQAKPLQASPNAGEVVVRPNLESSSQSQPFVRASDQTHQTKNALATKKGNITVEKSVPQTQRISSTARECSAQDLRPTLRQNTQTVPEIPIQVPGIATQMETAVLSGIGVSSHKDPNPTVVTQTPQNPPPPKMSSPTNMQKSNGASTSHSRVVYEHTVGLGNITSAPEKNAVQNGSSNTPHKGVNNQQHRGANHSAGLMNGYGVGQNSRLETQPMNSSIGQLREQMRERQKQYEEAYKKHYAIQLKKVMEEFGKKNGDRRENRE